MARIATETDSHMSALVRLIGGILRPCSAVPSGSGTAAWRHASSGSPLRTLSSDAATSVSSVDCVVIGAGRPGPQGRGQGPCTSWALLAAPPGLDVSFPVQSVRMPHHWPCVPSPSPLSFRCGGAGLRTCPGAVRPGGSPCGEGGGTRHRHQCTKQRRLVRLCLRGL